MDLYKPATVFSLFPLSIEESRNTVPGEFKIDASDGIIPSFIHIGRTVCYRHSLDPNIPMITEDIDPQEVARSIVDDFVRGQSATSDIMGPGLFYLEGKLSNKDLVKGAKYHKHYVNAIRKQTAWFHTIVEDADQLYADTNSPMVVSLLAKKACDVLNWDREWNVSSDYNVPNLDALLKQQEDKADNFTLSDIKKNDSPRSN